MNSWRCFETTAKILIVSEEKQASLLLIVYIEHEALFVIIYGSKLNR